MERNNRASAVEGNDKPIFNAMEMSVGEIAKKIRETRETGETVTFRIGHENRIVRKAMMNGSI